MAPSPPPAAPPAAPGPPIGRRPVIADRRETVAGSTDRAATATGQAASMPVPATLASNVLRVATTVQHRHGLSVNPAALIQERAETTGLAAPPDGQTSRNGSCRLIRASDGWMALNLSRSWDFDALGAWAGSGWTGADPPGSPGSPGATWQAVRRSASTMTTAEAVERAQLLGMAAAALPGEWTDDQARARQQCPPRRPWLAHPSPAGGRQPRRRPLVVDLSSLWAGPLAARLLSEWGAEVVKVEDPDRPDGLRAGGPAFYERLNRGKHRVTLSLPLAVALTSEADVVITSARPRVWDQLQVPPICGTWVRITGYGNTGPWRDRVAFGDDAAVAGGLVWAGDPPAFVGDAVADPLTGMVAACAALWGLAGEGGRVVDIAMREVAGWLARPGSGDPEAGGDRWLSGPDGARG